MTSNDSPFEDEDDEKAYKAWVSNLDLISKAQIKRMGATTLGFWRWHKELEAEKKAREKNQGNSTSEAESEQ